jgi:hypothetical protein
MNEHEQKQASEDRHKKLQIIREVKIEAESFYGTATQLGDHAAYAVGTHRSQMTGLENIADTALNTADIFDYIKRQTARLPYWHTGFREEKTGFGERLKNYLENDLKSRLNTLCDNRLNIGDKEYKDKLKRQQIYLMLIRQFIRQMVVQYEYRISFLDKKQEGNKSVNAHS